MAVFKRFIAQYIFQALKSQHAPRVSKKDKHKIWILLEVKMLGYGEQWVPRAFLLPLCVQLDEMLDMLLYYSTTSLLEGRKRQHSSENGRISGKDLVLLRCFLQPWSVLGESFPSV